MPNTDAQLLSEIKAFLKEMGMSPTTFGSNALADPSFVFQMEDKTKPRSPSGRVADRVRKYMADERKKLEQKPTPKSSNRKGGAHAAA